MYAITSSYKIVYGPNANELRSICAKRYPGERILCIKKLVHF